jgi:phage baseplate assembly protein V
MIAAMIIPCVVVGVDLLAPAVRVKSGDWASAWVRWHSQAAGKARHWRAPSLGEQGILFNPSGQAGMGTFVPGLFGAAGSPPDNRDHVEVWRFDDGGSLVYDWEAKSYSITVPTGTVSIKVGATEAVVTDGALTVTSTNIKLVADVEIEGSLLVTKNVAVHGALHAVKDITSAGRILDAGGNSANHKH